MSVLLSTHNIACTSEFKVAHCNFKTAAKFGKFSYSCKSFLLNFSKNLAASECKVSIGTPCASADSSPQLMKLRKSHFVGIFNYQSICIWQVNACFNNCCAYKHVNFLFKHTAPNFAQLIFFHLSVANTDLCLGNSFHNFCRCRLNCTNVVMQIEHLTASP